jgi:uncharacterized membrane protein
MRFRSPHCRLSLLLPMLTISGAVLVQSQVLRLITFFDQSDASGPQWMLKISIAAVVENVFARMFQ